MVPLAVVLLLGGPARTLEPTAWPGTKAVVQLTEGDKKLGAACVVGPRTAYTADHVIDGRALIGWGVGGGPVRRVEGLVAVRWRNKKRDLARISPMSWDFTDPVPVARTARMGEDVLVISDHYLTGGRLTFTGTISGMDDDGTVVLDIAGYPGSSGGCVLNARGELVAIYLGRVWVKNGSDAHRNLGMARPVWGTLEDIEK